MNEYSCRDHLPWGPVRFSTTDTGGRLHGNDDEHEHDEDCSDACGSLYPFHGVHQRMVAVPGYTRYV